MDVEYKTSASKLVQCRICHDEDKISNMETPCACSGSLKYAHRNCVQRWCNEKGDTLCEICLQQFRPDYTAAPPLFSYLGIPLHLSSGHTGDRETFRRDLNNRQIMEMIYAASHESTDAEFFEPSRRSVICCRVIAVIFILLLVLRHTLSILVSEAGEYSLTLFLLLMLTTIGILLHIYVFVRAFAAIQHRWDHQQDHPYSPASYEVGRNLRQHQSRVIHIL